MIRQKVIFIAFSFAAIAWIIPSKFVTIKILRNKYMPKEIKNEFLKLSWQIPLLGNIICWMKFARIGKLRKLSGKEHRSIWAAYRGPR